MITQNYGLVHPSCEVLVNGQKRKLYGKNKNKVYLNNGDEIQLKVFKPFLLSFQKIYPKLSNTLIEN